MTREDGLTQPTLVANDDSDLMIPPVSSQLLADQAG